MTNFPEIEKKLVLQKKMTAGDLAKNLANMRAKDAEKISGVFRYLEHPKGSIEFRWNGTYGGMPYDHYCLLDQQRYSLPRGLIKHLNNNVHYFEYQSLDSTTGMMTAKHSGASGYADGRKNNQSMSVKKKVPRTEFIVLEFLGDDNDILPSHMVEVTAAPLIR